MPNLTAGRNAFFDTLQAILRSQSGQHGSPFAGRGKAMNASAAEGLRKSVRRPLPIRSTAVRRTSKQPLTIPSLPLFLSLFLIALHFRAEAQLLTVETLRSEPRLSPQKFASFFSDFRYAFHEEIQPPALFLARRAGDCDDYATLADAILAEKGYATRLVAVRMPGLLTHVVCYVVEDRIYLDYNNRSYLVKTERAKPGLREIASKVAKSFNASWTSASEFTYTNGFKRMIATAVHTDKGDQPPAAPSLQIGF
jgi:hypothetical protein